jgi:hypothetical protein
MVNREEPRITQVEQGIELGDRSLPVYNLKDQEFTFGAFAAWGDFKFDDKGEITGVDIKYLNFREYFDAQAIIATEIGEGLKTEFLETVECDVFDSKLSHILEKSTCIP